jgi:predicted nucleic acid-binding protein
MARWFIASGSAEWATTAGVQAGFLRVSMNAAVTGRAVTLAEAQQVLKGLLAIGSHRLVHAVPPAEWPQWLVHRVQGYRQVTDASLVASAAGCGAVLATLDAAVADLLDAGHEALALPVPY